MSVKWLWRRVMMALCLVTLSGSLWSCGGAEDSEVLIGCRLNSDCPIGQVCADGECVDGGECVGEDCPCLSNADCTAGQGCDAATGECFDIQCLGDGDCALGDVCAGNRCVTDVDADRDRDGVPDNVDLCPEVEDSEQEDNDGDGRGDACDDDDDDDGLSDTIDNCPLTRNPVQGDADGDGQGNACDEDTPAIGVRGVLDFTALPGATTAGAQVFIGGNDAVGIGEDGAFSSLAALTEPGRFTVRVEWSGFLPVVRELVAPDGVAEIELEPILMVPVSDDDAQSATAAGLILLEGLEIHEGVAVRARVNGSLVATTFTDEGGHFVLELPPVSLSLHFGKEGFEPLEVPLVYNTQGELEGRFTRNDVLIEEVDDLVLERSTGTASVSVEVLPDWVPSGQRAVTVTIVGEGEERSAVANEAPVVFTDLPSGSYIAFANRPGFSQALQSFVLDQNQPSVNLTLTVALTSLGDAALDLSGATLTGAQLREAGNLRGANLGSARVVGQEPDTGAQLCGLDLSGVSLVGADLTNANLAGTNLTGARLDNASLAGGDLRSANLSDISAFGANFSGANFSNGAYDCLGLTQPGGRTRLTSANLSSASLDGARFVTSDDPAEGEPCALAEAASPELSQVRWSQTSLSGAIMHSTMLRDAEMTATVLGGADLRGACLSGATLLRVDMTDADARGAALDDVSALDALWLRTDLSGASLDGAALSDVNLTNANLDDLSGRGLSMAGVLVGGATMIGAQLEQSRWVGALLNDLDLTNAQLGGADMRNVQMVDVTLDGVVLAGVDLRNAGLSAMDLEGVDFRGARLAGADMSLANVEGANFDEVVLLGTRFTLARYDTQTQWPENFEFRFLQALGPETQMAGFVFPNGFEAIEAELRDADLTGATMINIDLSNATFSGADLRGAVMTNARLGGADLSGAITADIEGGCPAVLPDAWACLPSRTQGQWHLLGPGAVLRCIDWREMDLSGLDLRGADLSREPSQCPEHTMVGADLSGTNLEGASLALVKAHRLTGACPSALPTDWSCHASFLAEDRFVRAFLNENFGLNEPDSAPDTLSLVGPGADLSKETFIGADLSGADLRGADLRDTAVLAGSLAGANLDGANLGAAPGGSGMRIGFIEDVGLAALSIPALSEACPPELPAGMECVQPSPEFGGPVCGDGRCEAGEDRGSCPDDCDGRIDFVYVFVTDMTRLRAVDLVVEGVDDELGCPDLLPRGWACDSENANVLLLRGPGADLRGVDFSGSGIDCDFFCALETINVRGADLRGANFNDSLLPHWDMAGADLRGASLADAEMMVGFIDGTNLVGARTDNLTSCPGTSPLEWVCRAQPNVDGFILVGPGADLRGVDLRGVNFDGSRLIAVNLEGAQLDGVDFSLATLSRLRAFDLPACPATLPAQWSCVPQPAAQRFLLFGEGAALDGADLRGVDFSGLELQGVDLSGADLENANFNGASLEDVNLSGARLVGANFADAQFTNLDLRGADLSGVALEGANLAGSKVSALAGTCPASLPQDWVCRAQPAVDGVVLLGPLADLAGAALVGVDMRGANLSEAVLGRFDGNAEVSINGGPDADLSGAQTFDMVGTCPFTLPEQWSCEAQIVGGGPMLVGPGVNLGGANLSGAILRGKNLVGADLSSANLNGADLANTNLNGADMTDAQVEGLRTYPTPGCPNGRPEGWTCNFLEFGGSYLFLGPGADLSGSFFEGVELEGIDFSEVTLVNVEMRGVALEGSDMSSALLEHVRAIELASCPSQMPPQWACVTEPRVENPDEQLPFPSNMDGAVFAGPTANLREVFMEGADLSHVDLSAADLSFASLRWANLTGAVMPGAELAGLRAYDMQGCPIDLPEGWSCFSHRDEGNAVVFGLVGDGAFLSSTTLAEADMSNLSLFSIDFSSVDFGSNANFDSTLLDGALMASTTLIGASMVGVSLRNATLIDADLSGSNLEGAVLDNAELTGANLEGAFLAAANLEGAVLDNAELTGANLEGANLTAASFTGANLGNAIFSDTTICPDGRTHAELPGCGF